jgi:hypothetical protein
VTKASLGRWCIALAAATAVAAWLPVATAAAPLRQARMPSSEDRPHHRHPPPPSKLPPPPSRAELDKVIGENRSSITACYQRALARDNGLADVEIIVRLAIGISGRVKNVGIDGLFQSRSLLEPCIREAVLRWIFPQASEEYGTEFPFVFRNGDDGEVPLDGCAITVNTTPWSAVWIDGKYTTRHTPVVDWKLPCGKHQITFKRPDMHIDQTWRINVSPGKTFRQQYSLTPEWDGSGR